MGPLAIRSLGAKQVAARWGRNALSPVWLAEEPSGMFFKIYFLCTPRHITNGWIRLRLQRCFRMRSITEFHLLGECPLRIQRVPLSGASLGSSKLRGNVSLLFNASLTLMHRPRLWQNIVSFSVDAITRVICSPCSPQRKYILVQNLDSEHSSSRKGNSLPYTRCS